MDNAKIGKITVHRLFNTRNNDADVMPINQHLVKQVKVGQMHDGVPQSLSCYDENNTAKKDDAAVDGQTMEKLDLLCDGDVTMPPEKKIGTEDLMCHGKVTEPPDDVVDLALFKFTHQASNMCPPHTKKE